jgi:pimeloyl-ACP methyl ester carboxylesterase
LAHIALAHSPLAPGRSPVAIRIRESGAADRAIVFLHSGWGYEIYPFDSVASVLASRFRIAAPDRSGYGGSEPIDALAADFHQRAAVEMTAVIDALTLESPVLWGHSDGAIIALLIALASPDRIAGVVTEAAHLWKKKPASRAFFDQAIANPDGLGAGAVAALERDHGARWRDVIRMHARAWRTIGDEAASATDDFYGGRLGDVAVPVMVVHGARDPRTEPGELDALTGALRSRSNGWTDVLLLPDGGHSPHSERQTAEAVAAAGSTFCAAIAAGAPEPRR